MSKLSMFAAAVAAPVFAACAADVEWLNAADGAWGTGANWSGGAVPDSARAVITNSSASFTVTAAEASNPKITGLLLQNADASGTTTLRVAGHLSSGNETLTIGGGGLLHVDGGVLAITNSSMKHILLSGTSATKKGVLKVSDGLLDFRSTSKDNECQLTLGSYGRFEASGGRILLSAPGEWNTKAALYCQQRTAEMEIGGNAVLELLYRGADIRLGRHILKDNASFICTNASGASFSVKASSAYGVYFAVSNNAVLNVAGCSAGYMGDHYWTSAENKSTLDIAGGTVHLPMSFVVGRANGTSVLNVSGGRTILDFYGLDIANYNPIQFSKKQNPVGKVNVSGGSLVVTSELGGNSDTAKGQISGLVVGNGSQIGTYHSTSGYSCAGSLNVSGGVVTNGIGLFVVGAGRATGRILQTGGVIYHGLGLNSSESRSRTPMIVGFAGGDGAYVMSNGFAVAQAPIYVGGVVTNVLDNRKLTSYWPGNAFTDRTASGKLVVAGGSLSTTAGGDLVVGSDGYGTLEIGSGATVSIGHANGSGNIILSNRVESVTRFVLGRNGAGSLTTPNALVVAEGAKLEVDVSRYEGDDKWIKLVGCSRREGSFASPDISVVGTSASGRCEVVQNRPGDSTGSVWLRVKHNMGLIISFR